MSSRVEGRDEGERRVELEMDELLIRRSDSSDHLLVHGSSRGHVSVEGSEDSGAASGVLVEGTGRREGR